MIYEDIEDDTNNIKLNVKLNKNQKLFGSIKMIKNATKAEIKNYNNDTNNLKKHSRHFAYIKFCYDCKEKKSYGIVGGKTNYTYPDLSFDELKNQIKKDNRYARNFVNFP